MHFSFEHAAPAQDNEYEIVGAVAQADYLVVDADSKPAVKGVVLSDRLADAIFIGASAPAGTAGHLPRPIDPARIRRMLDDLGLRRLLAMSRPEPPPDGVLPTLDDVVAEPDLPVLTVPVDTSTLDTPARAAPPRADASLGEAPCLEPPELEPLHFEPTHREPMRTEPTRTEAARVEPRRIEPAWTEPALAAAARREPAWLDPPSPAASIAAPSAASSLAASASTAATARLTTLPAPLVAEAPGADPALSAAKTAARSAARRARLANERAKRPAAEPRRDVLVLDPDPAALSELCELLGRFGFDVHPAHTIAQADELLRGAPFAAFFLDIALDGADRGAGLALVQRIHDLAVPAGQAAAPVLVVSAQLHPADRVRAALAGISTPLVKPVSRGAVARALETVGVALPSDARSH